MLSYFLYYLFLRLHLSSSGQVLDGKVLPKLVENITTKQIKEVDIAMADGSYGSISNLEFLSFKGIKLAIKV